MLATIFPVFAIALLGYILTWSGVFRLGDIAGLTRYVFNVALPVMLFDSMSRIELPETVRWSFLLAYFLPGLVIYAVGAAVGHRVFRQSRAVCGVYAMGCSYSNTVFLALPVVAAAWGDVALLPLLLIIAVHSAFFFTLTTAVVEFGRRGIRAAGSPGRRAVLSVFGRTALGMLRNPIVIGLLLGVLYNYAGLAVPAVMQSVITPLRASALPAALFVTGASLRQYRPMGHLPESLVAIVLKLVAHPILVWGAAVLLFRLSPEWVAVAVVTAAMPTGINASVFAVKYDAAVAPVATAVLFGTALSLASLTALLLYFSPAVVG